MPLELSYRLCPKLSPSVASLLNDTSMLQLSLENSTDHLLYSSCDSQVKDTSLPCAHILQELPYSPHLKLLHTALQPGDLGTEISAVGGHCRTHPLDPAEPATAVTLRA